MESLDRAQLIASLRARHSEALKHLQEARKNGDRSQVKAWTAAFKRTVCCAWKLETISTSPFSSVRFPTIADISQMSAFDPLRTIREWRNAHAMRCYYVLVHGKLAWSDELPTPSEEEFRPGGFYCHRYVLSSDENEARDKAFERVRDNLASWLSNGAARLELEAEEVTAAPMHKLLKPENRGHSFYERD